MKIKILVLSLLLLGNVASQAQRIWHNPLEAGFPVIQNQAWPEEIGMSYVRLPDRAEQHVRKPLWDLSRNAAGLSIHFYCNAPEISVRYGVTGGLNMPHMPTSGVSGIDMYSINSDGKWAFCFGGYSFGDTIRYNYTNLGKDKYHNRGYEYRLFLPLYNSVKWLEIGIPESSELTFIPQSPEKPIVLYGTSIAQGACASRSAMAWGNILQRAIDFPLVNLGFSGNGRLEKEMLELIAEIDARLYILDCLPNLSARGEDELYELIVKAVRQLREKRLAPILLVEHLGLSYGETNSEKKKEYEKANAVSKKAYTALLEEGIDNLFYLTKEELNIPADGWVDYIHPTDLGMQAQAKAVEKKVRDILKMPLGELSTTIPVTQRREPNTYEWLKRHREILAANRQHPPRAVIFGNSITHFWGGETSGPRKRGIESWEKLMAPAGFRNMGYGWDRIENVLWRVYHGELDGYQAEKIVVMIGTNNIDHNTKEEILEGLRTLYRAIRQRQPKAEIKVAGILPRRGKEEYVKELNTGIREITIADGYQFVNPGKALLTKEGKVDETLFSDGLHPNEKGYRLIADEIAH